MSKDQHELRDLVDALADAVERLLLAHALEHAADEPEHKRDEHAVVSRRTRQLLAEDGTALLDRIQELRRAAVSRSER